MIKRFTAVVVLYAAVFLLIVLIEAFFPTLGVFSLWMHSSMLKLVILAVLWLIAPTVIRYLEKLNSNGST